MSRVVWAIDPGTEQSAFVELEKEGSGTGVVERVGRKMIKPNEELLQLIYDLTEFERPNCFALEEIASYGMAVGRSVFHTCFWTGRFQEAFTSSTERKTIYITRKKVALHLCMSARAKDPNIRQALIDRFGGKNKALGGKKCPKCKGKGWFGRGRPTCPECQGGGWLYPPGPLNGIVADMWSALAVAVTVGDLNR